LLYAWFIIVSKNVNGCDSTCSVTTLVKAKAIHLQLANAEGQTRLATELKYIFGFEVAQCLYIVL